MQETLRHYLQKIMESSITHVFLLFCFPPLLAFLTGNIGLLIEIGNTPLPLWAAISLILIYYLHIDHIKAKIHAKLIPPNPKGVQKEIFIDSDKVIKTYKHKIIIYNDNTYDVEDSLYCRKHDIKLIIENTHHLCIQQNCIDIPEYIAINLKQTGIVLAEKYMRTQYKKHNLF